MWITLKLVDSKEMFKFMINVEEVTFSLDELQTMLKLPLATANNNVEFVEPPETSVMLEFLDIIGHAKKIHLAGQFYTKNLPQLWQILRKILMECLTTRITEIDQPPLHIMQMFYCIVNNVHVDYVSLIWEGLHYLLMHPTTYVPYPRFMKLIIDYILMKYPDIPNQTNELHHYVANDEVVQSIFNFGKTNEKDSRSISLKIVIKKRNQPDPETLIPTAEQIDVEILDDATQDVNKLVEGEESSHEDPDTKIYLGNHNESPEAKKVVECVFVDEEVDKETTEVVSIQRKWKGSIDIRDTPLATPTRSPRTDSLSSDKEKLQESTASKPSSSLSKHKFDRSR
ncbi:hypothetical protein Tco_1527724, partial [Tanacetum coccineum]